MQLRLPLLLVLLESVLPRACCSLSLSLPAPNLSNRIQTVNTTTPYPTRLLCALVSASLFMSGCGGGGTPATPDAPPAADAQADSYSEAPPTVLSQATTDQDVERLRLLGYEVVEVTGDTTPDSIVDPVEPQLIPVSPPDGPASAAASDGRAQILSAGRAAPLIVGGALANPGQFDFTVYLRSDAGACTASLIAPQWIKTAAHCVPSSSSSTTTGTLTAYLGSVVRGAGAEVINGDYFVRFNNDTALVHLVRPSAITPIAYNDDAAFEIAGPITLVGFGRTSYEGSTSDLKVVEISAIQRYGASLVLGVPGSMQTACMGDSGGPNLRYAPSGYPIDVGTNSATYSPYCTGLSLSYSTSSLATSIQNVVGVPPWSVPTANLPPVIAPVAPLETAIGPTSVAIPASDPEGNPIVFAASGLPAGLSINPATGVISGTTTEFSYVSPSVVTVIATDKTTSARRSVTFPWRINTPGNASPVFSVIPSQTSAAGRAASLTLTASDPNGDQITYSASGLPPGMSIGTSGVISGSPSLAGSYQVNVYAVDLKGGMGLANFNWTITNQAPSVRILSATTEMGFATGSQFSIPYESSDPDQDAVTVTATGLPTGVSVNPDPAIKAITGSSKTPGVYTVVLIATDPYGASSVTGFTLAISSAFNRPPTITPLQARTDLPGVAITPIALNPVDPDGHGMVLSFIGLPPGVVYDSKLKSLRGTPVKGGTYSVQYSVYDVYGARTNYEPIIWTIPNASPVLVPPTPVAQYLPGVSLTLPYTVSDPDGHTVTVRATGLPKGLVVYNTTKTITGMPLVSGIFNVTLTATDRYSGKTVAEPFQINVPNQAPVIASNLPDITTVAGTSVSLPMDVSDPDGHKLLISVSGINVYPLASSLPPGLLINSVTKTISGKPTRGGVYTVALKVADVYGAATYMPAFKWTVVNTPPVLQPVSNLSLRNGAAASFQLSSSDPEGHPVTYKVTGLPPGLRVNAATGLVSGTPAANVGAYRCTTYARDAYGLNSETLTFTINITN